MGAHISRVRVKGLLIGIAVTSLAASAFLLAVWLRADGYIEGEPYAVPLDDVRGRAEDVASWGDGQGFWLLATDPLLEHPRVEAGEAAYRSSRPAVSYLAWAVSGGRPELAAEALLLTAVLLAGTAALALGRWLLHLSLPPEWSAMTLAIPGAIASLPNGGAELGALAGVLLGVTEWVEERRWRAVAAFVAAALFRETALIAVAAIALWSVHRTRRPIAAAPLALPFLVWGSWIAAVRVRYGAWPSVHDGLIKFGVPQPGDASGWALLLVLFSVSAFAIWRGGLNAWIVSAYGVFVLATGPAIWTNAHNWTRVFLPAFAFGAFAFAEAWGSWPAATGAPSSERLGPPSRR